MSDIPQWFWDAVETDRDSGNLDVDECEIHYQTWSGEGNPGLLFVHGHNAHAHWWDFIAPRFRDRYQTVALDLSGMGDSDHRDEYSTDLFAREIIAVADAAAMPTNSVVVAHSFGGIMSLRSVASSPGRFKGLVLVDSGVKHPDDIREQDVERWSRPKVYPSREVALSRFRLQPPQQCNNEYLVQYIARNSVDAIDEGFVWKFDEELNSRMTHTGDTAADLQALTCPVALIYGADSASFSRRSADYMKELKPELEVIELPDAQHHLFLDQPEAFMEQLDSILKGWE